MFVSAGLRLGRPPPAAMSQLEAFAGNLEMLDFFALIKGRCWAPRPLRNLPSRLQGKMIRIQIEFKKITQGEVLLRPKFRQANTGRVVILWGVFLVMSANFWSFPTPNEKKLGPIKCRK